MENVVLKYIWLIIGGLWGWFCGIFEPAFPLIIVATCFILWDAYAAYKLDVRVHKAYPDKTQRSEAKFVSWKFAGVIPTMIERYVLIFLFYLAQVYIFVDVYIPLSYMAAGVVAAEQFLSVCENNASCRLEGEKNAKLWKVMGKIFADKTERHFDIDISGLEPDGMKSSRKRVFRKKKEEL
jgi:hypothetical protein